MPPKSGYYTQDMAIEDSYMGRELKHKNFSWGPGSDGKMIKQGYLILEKEDVEVKSVYFSDVPNRKRKMSEMIKSVASLPDCYKYAVRVVNLD